MTMNGVMAVILRCFSEFSEFSSFLGALHKVVEDIPKLSVTEMYFKASSL